MASGRYYVCMILTHLHKSMKNITYPQLLHYGLLVSSAVLYALAYLVPVYCWWTTLIFLVPLFYGVVSEKFTVYDAVTWSTIAFSMHLSGVLEGLFLMAQSEFIMRFIPALLILSTAIIYGTIWFAISIVLSDRMVLPLYRLAVWGSYHDTLFSVYGVWLSFYVGQV